MFAQSTNTEEIPEASETNVDLDYEDNEDGGKLGRLFFTVTTTLILMTMTMMIMKKMRMIASWGDSFSR